MKKVLYSLLMIGIVTTIAVGSGTMAYFNDTETNSGNTFTAGTLDLDVGSSWTANVDNAGPGSNADATGGLTFDITDVAPGDTAKVTIDTTNNGNIDIESLTFDIGVTDSEPTGDTEPEAAAEDAAGIAAGETDISTKITVTSLIWDTTAPNYATHDPDNDGFSDLAERIGDADNVVTLRELADAPPFDITDVDGHERDLEAAGGIQVLMINLTLQDDTGDEYQGDRSTIDLTLEAFQNEQ